MLYSFTRKDQLPLLPGLAGLEIRECTSPLLMAKFGKISQEEAVNRFARENKAYVAYYQGRPAAFGWMAMGQARVGELNHEFELPLWHRYLWNFRTLEDFRGLGIYPRLLQHILTSEGEHSAVFWIMHAPENKASEKGILKAGFRLRSKVSVARGSEVRLQVEKPSEELQKLIEACGFINTFEEQASCWNCSSPYIKNKKIECCCTIKSRECNSEAFLVSML